MAGQRLAFLNAANGSCEDPPAEREPDRSGGIIRECKAEYHQRAISTCAIFSYS